MSSTNRTEQVLQESIARILDNTRKHCQSIFDHAAYDCQSEIELMMLIALWSASPGKDSNSSPYPDYFYSDQGNIGNFIWSSLERGERINEENYKEKSTEFIDHYSPSQHGVIILPQFVIYGYRLDFLIAGHWPSSDLETFNCVAVECDGHDYHERTKEQAIRDKARDRFLAECGIPTMRFTGREIWQSPHDCANQALRFLFARAYPHSVHPPVRPRRFTS